jgi:hypothetical protein
MSWTISSFNSVPLYYTTEYHLAPDYTHAIPIHIPNLYLLMRIACGNAYNSARKRSYRVLSLPRREPVGLVGVMRVGDADILGL